MADMMERLRLEDAARMIGCSPRSLGNPDWRQRIGVPHFKIGSMVVFDRQELDAWVRAHRVEGSDAT